MRLHLKMAAGIAAFALVGCAATKEEVANTLENRFVGKNVDMLVSQFGPPASAFRMNSGEAAYVWQLSSVTSINTEGGSGTAKTRYCKINAIASSGGIVTKLTTEDSSGTLAVLDLVGPDITGSVCAKYLGIQRSF